MTPADVMRDVRLRVWAEIGRTHIKMSRAVAIQPGEVVELDAGADAPVDLYVNGRRLGTGTLLRMADAEWAIRIDSLESSSAEAGPPALVESR